MKNNLVFIQEEIKQKYICFLRNANTPNEEKEKKELFNDDEIKLIYEFSDKINLNDIYPAFSKISDMNKNFSDDIIEYLKILKNNEIIVHNNLTEKSTIILIPEQTQFCFMITVIIYLYLDIG